MLPCSVGYFLAMSHILLMYNIWHVRSLCMHRCKQNSKHENVPPSLHRIQQALYPSAFSFFLELSHFILIPPVCFFYHLSLCVFLSLLPICSCLCCCLMLCLSVSLRISDLCKILSPPWFQVLNGYGFMRGVAGVRDRRNAVYWGKAFSKSQKRLEKRAKAECTKHAMYVLQQDLRGDILIDWAQTLTRGEAAIWEFATSKSEFQASPLCFMSTVHRQVITSIEMYVLSVLFLRITFHLLINYQCKAPCWTQPNRYT